MISFRFEVFKFFCDKDKLFNLRDRRISTNLWGPLFSIYLQLRH